VLLQALIGRGKVFGDHPRFADDRYEIGVPRPSRHYVKVNVFGNPGARSFSKIHPDVEAIGLILLLQRDLRLLGKFEHLGSRSLIEGRERGNVLVGDNHQMAACIGEQIEDDEDPFPSVKDKIPGVIRVALHSAEYAGLLSLLACDVSVAPGTPDVLHTRTRH